MASQPRQGNNPGNPAFLPNGAPAAVPTPGAAPLLPNQGRIVQAANTRILCVADVRGNLTSLNELAKASKADCIIHTGDFGFYDDRSLDRIAEKTLKHVVQYSPLISDQVKKQVSSIGQAANSSHSQIRSFLSNDQLRLSQLPEFLDGTSKFDVPVYAVWGACEDVQVLEKLRSGEYKIDKLNMLDEANTRLLDVGGIKLRLMGLGGAMVMHKLFDNGEGRTTIAGGHGTMWATFLQMGELIDTANRVYDPSETRVFVTHASPARDGLLNQLTVALKTDFSISAGLHFRYGSSYNEFSVNPTLDHYRGKLASAKASFNDVWETVKSQVEPAVAENDAQQKLLDNALAVINRMPTNANGSNPFGGLSDHNGTVDEVAFKNTWHFNLADAAFGYLVLEIEGGRIGTEMKAQGFNFAHRGMKGSSISADKLQAQAQSAAPVQPAAQPGNQNLNPHQGPPVPQSAPQAVQSQSQPGPHPPATTKSPAPATPSSKPTTGVASTSATNGPTALAAADSKTNGIASPTPGTEVSALRATPPAAERRPSTGIFITGVKDEEEAKTLFSEEDRLKIQRIDRIGKYGLAAHFSTNEEMMAVLSRAPMDLKRSTPGKPGLKVYQERTSYPRPSHGQTGYRSGGESGGASDRESGRGGRGVFRGSRGGRGGTERGRGQRVLRGTRGPSGEVGSAASPTSPAPPPATSS